MSTEYKMDKQIARKNFGPISKCLRCPNKEFKQCPTCWVKPLCLVNRRQQDASLLKKHMRKPRWGFCTADAKYIVTKWQPIYNGLLSFLLEICDWEFLCTHHICYSSENTWENAGHGFRQFIFLMNHLITGKN